MIKTFPQRELRQIQLAQQHRSGGLQPRHHHGIGIRHIIPSQRRAVSSANPGGIELVFNRHRNAVQRPQIPPGGDLGLGRPRRPQCLVAADRDVRIKPPVKAFNSLQKRFGGRHRRNLPRPD